MRRIAAIFVTLFAVFGIFATTGGTAFAETADTSPQANMYMYYDVFNNTGTTTVYDPRVEPKYGWYLCEENRDCNSLETNGTGGVQLISDEKGNASVATDQQILSGSLFYAYIDNTGHTLYDSFFWNGHDKVAASEYIYTSHDHAWHLATFASASLELYWSEYSLPPTCDTATLETVGSCSMK